MNEELALRTIGYLIGHYKTHNETIINSQEIEAINFISEENQKLKEQLEEYKRLGFKHLNDKCNKLENQQKEFMNWLEENWKITQDIWYIKILNKYKEIIGVKE